MSKNKRFKSWEAPKFDEKGKTEWGWICQHNERLDLGKLTDIGAFTYINAKHGVQIGELTQVGSHCSIYTESTIDDKKGEVRIGNNARIGSHSVIMPGVTIGKNSVVGAFSFVNKDIPDNTLSFGVPVKVVKKIKDE